MRGQDRCQDTHWSLLRSSSFCISWRRCFPLVALNLVGIIAGSTKPGVRSGARFRIGALAGAIAAAQGFLASWPSHFFGTLSGWQSGMAKRLPTALVGSKNNCTRNKGGWWAACVTASCATGRVRPVLGRGAPGWPHLGTPQRPGQRVGQIL